MKIKTLQWIENQSELIFLDQRVLPGQVEYITCRTYQDVVIAIRDMVVRGAPAIGASAAYGMALAACTSNAKTAEQFVKDLEKASQDLFASRPTAINLAWALRRMQFILIEQKNSSVEEIRQRICREADLIAEEDVKTNLQMAAHGEGLIQDGDTIIHHCNTGSLATVDWGTALGVIRMAFEKGKRIHVLVDETRPRLQGARLTAWELQQYGISYEIISDSAAGYYIHSGQVQKVFFGADRVAANGDVVNKIGSYMLALAAHTDHVPVYSVFPTSTVDMRLNEGRQIPIEERDPDEVLGISVHGQLATPPGAKARNPAFDITPFHLLTGLVTEKGVVHQPFGENLPRIMNSLIAEVP